MTSPATDPAAPAATTETHRAEPLPAPPVPRLPPPWVLRALGPGDGRTVADWMSRPHVSTRWHQDWGEDRWRHELARQVDGDHSRPVAAAFDGRDVAYLELYRVDRDRLAGHYAHDLHDLGVHIALVESGDCGRGLGNQLLGVVADALLVEDPDCVRIVAEPDERNHASVRAFEKAGFRESGSVVLAHKTATLMRRERVPQTSRPGR